jgi:O-antigen/teichoic acid export membrane protein
MTSVAQGSRPTAAPPGPGATQDAVAQAEKSRIWRQGTWLFFATVLNSGQGVIFWAIAARLVSASAIGFAASVLSLAALASAFALLGLDQSLIRYLGESKRPRRLFALSLLLSGIVGAALGGILSVLVYSQVHSASEEFLEVLPIAGALLAFFAIAFRLSNVLVLSAGHSGWVMVQSTILGVGKILVLVALVLTVAVGSTAILLSFGASYIAAIAVGVVAGFALWPALRPNGRTPSPSEITRFSLGNYASSSLWTLPDRIAPSIVLIVFSAAATSYFYYGQLVAFTLFYLPESICTSAFAHAARHQQSTAHRMRSLAPALAVLAIVLAAITILLAPWILYLLGGPSYAAHATLLRIYAVATIPQAGVFYLQSVYMVERRMRELVWIGAIPGLVTLASLGAAIQLRVGLDYLPAAWIVGNTVGLLVALGWSRDTPRRWNLLWKNPRAAYSELLRPAVRDAYQLAIGMIRPSRSSGGEPALGSTDPEGEAPGSPGLEPPPPL